MNKNNAILLIILIFVLTLILGCQSEIKAGGDCSYQVTKGICTITSFKNSTRIEWIKYPDEKKETATDEMIIKFEFKPIEPIKVKGTFYGQEVANYLGIKCLDNLHKYPITKKDLEDCNIKENDSFNCEYSVIQGGSCSPDFFRFI